MEKLYEKYDKALPRYTSYPALPHWNKALNPFIWLENVNEHLSGAPELDIYIHIPYCKKLCWYCGCNREIAKSESKADPYITALRAEWSFLLRNLGSASKLKIKSIHLGGGTPTFLNRSQLESMLEVFRPYISNDFIGAVEIDPRTLTDEQLDVFKEYKFSRASLGIQDFDPEVQKQINRIQSYELVVETVSKLRANGFKSINFDLIYGLPAQSPETVKATIQKSLTLKPDLISFYSYAHLPERIKNQRLINADLLASSSEKRALYEGGRQELLGDDFVEIGLDHFAKKGSYLETALRENKLQRSFMGYTDQKSKVLIGLGATSISNTPSAYKQNEKNVKEYINQITLTGEASITTSHLLTPIDQEQNLKIQKLMCTQRIPLTENLNPRTALKLNQFVIDGLLEMKDDCYSVTEIGNIFLRNICAIFDEYLEGQTEQKRFSQSV
ncbi:oxygen-independent coproporphyrinogen III oxidase [Bacteriovorax sp. Seq25_V]|uniref:oxygen-independent coproporphyrinogen III oxidase n=1 Tax=Bacteriovorax sp. Seq25_V TaxID=1201288 RepID=UPI00038A1CF6|nr:oxygen-independent coproporphyrinogen III oxidase [Bacteriovorax sp. Seq25_V]EQC45724.1 coproporphyrinogen dehydrogenase [Bacteriovorax sp. Seq25_V]